MDATDLGFDQAAKLNIFGSVCAAILKDIIIYILNILNFIIVTIINIKNIIIYLINIIIFIIINIVNIKNIIIFIIINIIIKNFEKYIINFEKQPQI